MGNLLAKGAKGFQYMLAPIEDMTSNAFRTVCFRHGADITFTELTRVEALARKNKCTWERIIFKDETPAIIQLLGAKEQMFKRFLSMFEPQKGFMGFNINMGCPSPDAVKIGQGCALMKRVAKSQKLVELIKDRGYHVSVKMRLGLNRFEKEKKAYLNIIRAVKADFFVVHARHGGQTYAEPADMSVYPECAATGKDIIANGDITTKEQVELLKSAGIKGVMIGRAAISDPSIFARLKGIECPPAEALKKEFVALSEKYCEPFRYRKNILKWIGKPAMWMHQNQ